SEAGTTAAAASARPAEPGRPARQRWRSAGGDRRQLTAQFPADGTCRTDKTYSAQEETRLPLEAGLRIAYKVATAIAPGARRLGLLLVLVAILVCIFISVFIAVLVCILIAIFVSVLIAVFVAILIAFLHVRFGLFASFGLCGRRRGGPAHGLRRLLFFSAT